VKALLFAGTACLLMAHASPARACGAPGTYQTSVDGNTVRIFAMSPCALGDVLLRQDAVSGAAVRVTATCADGWYVDSCVAPGTYRYGFETPYATTSDCACGPYDYYGLATVSAPLTCAFSDIGVDDVPWANDQTICTPETSCTAPSPGAPCESPAPSENAGGCALATGTMRPWWLIGVGLLLLRRRRIMR